MTAYDLDFSEMSIAFVNYSTGSKWGIRECHGFMSWQTHLELHSTIGTYRDSGGTLSNYVLESNTAADRRPDISTCVLYDEDLKDTLPALTTNLYTQYYLSSNGDPNFVLDATDIVPLNGNRPYYNQLSGGVYVQTLLPNNYFMIVWVVAVPATSDTDSQKYRFVFQQGQRAESSLTEINAVEPNRVNAGDFTFLTPESDYIAKIVIEYRGGNWDIVSVQDLTGTRISQALVSADSIYLSTVSTDSSITGEGTTDSPLSLNILSGDGTPSTTPEFLGQEYYDTTNKLWYKAGGTSSSSDWESLGNLIVDDGT